MSHDVGITRESSHLSRVQVVALMVAAASFLHVWSIPISRLLKAHTAPAVSSLTYLIMGAPALLLHAILPTHPSRKMNASIWMLPIVSLGVSLARFIPPVIGSDVSPEHLHIPPCAPWWASSDIVLESIIGTILVAPLIEEVLFRGLLLRLFLRRNSQLVSVLLCSLIFAWWHTDARYPDHFAVGMMTGAAYVRFRNILAPTLIHGAWNAGVLVVDYYEFEVKWDVDYYAI